MLLYHGTAGVSLDTLLVQGLQPRGKKKGHWEHTSLSRPDSVYLTRAYGPYFMGAAASNSGSSLGVVVEIESDRIAENLVPDEDCLEQANRTSDGIRASIKKRTRYYRSRLPLYAGGAWAASIAMLGNCCHLGAIPAPAFTRVALIDLTTNSRVLRDFDASITLINYRLLGENYHWMTRRLFGDDCADAPTDEIHSYKIACTGVRVGTVSNNKITNWKTVTRSAEPPAIYKRFAAQAHLLR